MVEIGNATSQELGAARALHASLLPDVDCDVWKQGQLQADELLLVARSPEVVGYLLGDIGGMSGTAAYVRELAVDSASQAMGMGRALLGAFAARVLEAGCDTLLVDAAEDESELELIAYYERCGFTDPTRWRTTRRQHRGRNEMLRAAPDVVIRATERWAPLVATNAWDIDGFGNGAFFDSYLLSPDVPPVRAGQAILEWLTADARDHSVSSPVIVVPTNAQAGSAGAIPLTSQYEWTAMRGTVTSDLEARPTVALWPKESFLLELDANRIAPLVVASTAADPAIEWARARGAFEIAAGVDGPRFERCEDPVVEVALRDLSNHVNRNTGLASPEDHDAAVCTFRLLRAGGHRFTPREVFIFAIANRWYGDGAVSLRMMAAKTLQGKAIKTLHREPWPDAVLERWRDDAGFLA